MAPFPHCLRALTLVLTIASFLPQLHTLLQRRRASGLSLLYVFFNLLSATEQLGRYLFQYLGLAGENAGRIVYQPVDMGDHLDLAQVSSVFVLWLIVYILCLYFPSTNSHRKQKISLSIISTGFFFITFLPILSGLFSSSDNDGARLAIFLSSIHSYTSPITTCLLIAAVIAQSRITVHRRGNDPGSLSKTSLAAQAVVFWLVAVTWPWRLEFPWALEKVMTANNNRAGGSGAVVSSSVFLLRWLDLEGWPAVNSGVFALGQVALFARVGQRGGEGDPRRRRVVLPVHEKDPVSFMQS